MNSDKHTLIPCSFSKGLIHVKIGNDNSDIFARTNSYFTASNKALYQE